MVTTPTPTNATATGVDQGISTAGNDIIAFVENAMLVDVPVLRIPVLKQIWQALFNWFASYYIKAAESGATFLIIDTQVNAEQSKLSQALQNLIAAEKTGNAATIQAAIQAYANSQSSLVHDDGSATPI